mgnify:CR=1 FL=1
MSISTAKKFCPDVEKEMDDTTVLQQLWIEEYAQELSLKGKLHFCLKEENGSTQEINTECYRFGTTLKQSDTGACRDKRSTEYSEDRDI